MLHARKGGAPRSAPTKRSVSAAELRAECSILERAVCTAKYADAAALVAYRPGGSENPDKGARGWLAFYRHLHRLHALEGRVSGDRAREHRADDAEFARTEAVVLD